jgi:hypothetical protein
MNADALADVLLVKSVEESDRAGEVLPLADREHATRDALRAAGAATPRTGAAGNPLFATLTTRAAILLGPLIARYPVLAALRGRTAWLASPSVAWLVLAGAFALGVPLGWAAGVERLNLLAFPFLGVVFWNLVVMAALLADSLWSVSRGAGAARPRAAWLRRLFPRALAGIVARTTGVHARLGEALSRFVADWSAVRAPLLQARASLALHVGAASLALGMIAGLYAAGIAVRYSAGWAAEWISAESALRALHVLFGAASAISGIPLPATVAEVAALQFPAGDAAPRARAWVHLMAITLALYAVLPRLLFAAFAALRARPIRRSQVLPDALGAYARRTCGASLAGRGSGVVVVICYACEVAGAARTGLQRWLEATYGRGAAADLRAVRYGEERSIEALLGHAAGGGPAEGIVLLLGLATTPEAENHGEAIRLARDAAARGEPAPGLHVLLDESAYARRMNADAALARRMDERRGLWRRFVAAYGLDTEFVDLGATP